MINVPQFCTQAAPWKHTLRRIHYCLRQNLTNHDYTPIWHKSLVSTVHKYHKMAARTCSLKFIKAQTDLTCLHAYHLTFLKKHIFLNTTEIKKNHPPFPAVTTLLEYIIIHKHLLSQRHKVYNQTHAGFI